MANKNDSKTDKSPKKSSDITSKAKKRNSKYKTFFKRMFMGVFILCLLCGVIALGYGFAIIKGTPPINVDSVLNLSQPSRLYDNKDEFIDDLPTEEIRYVVDSAQIPNTLKNAYVAIEDERFFQHKGIDIKRIMGAIYRDVIFYATGKGGLQGASTLTQQLIKNTLLSNDTTIERKVKEIYLSLQLEKQLNKDQIITAYLNTIPLGGLVYGVEAASNYYFNKKAIDLTLPECAFIAGLTQAPTSYSPYNPANAKDPDDVSSPIYVKRTLLVLNKMKELNFITDSEFASASDFVEKNEFAFSQGNISGKVEYESFVYSTLDQVKKDLKQKYKYTDDEISKLLVNGGLKIYTTMDRSLQDSTQAILDDRNNINVDANKGDPKDDYGTPKLQASAVIMDYRTGQVKALIGGRGKQPPRSTNRAYDTYRSIASTTKPLTVFGPALDTKMFTAGTPIDDAGLPKSIKDKFPKWNPKNYDGSMEGYVDFRECLAESKNVPTIMVADDIGVNTAVSYGEKLGIKYKEDSKNLSTVSLGEFTGVENGDSGDGGNVFTLSAAYGTFGNNGTYIKPKLYTKVVDSTGNVILEENTKDIQVFSPQTAYIMQDLLKQSGIEGKMSNDIPVIGKTGTSENVTDFWFAGLTPYYSGSVWIGYDYPTKMSGYSSAAAKLWAKIMSPAHNGLDYKEISPQPSGITKVLVCTDSGKRPTDLCYKDQRGSRVSTEMFIEGTEPNGVCNVHVTATVNKNNNKLANNNTPKDLITTRVFIRKPNANPNAADYKYVVPTQQDDTKAEAPKPEPPKPEEPKPEVDNKPTDENKPTTDAKPEDENKPTEENKPAEERTVPKKPNKFGIPLPGR